MAGAGLAVDAGAQLANKAYETTKAELDRLAEDPVAEVGRLCRKIGAILMVGGGLCYVGKIATDRATQQYLNDAQARLGLQPSKPPTPAPANTPPPAQSYYQADIQAVVSVIANLSTSNAHDAGAAMLDAYTALWDLMNRGKADGMIPRAIDLAAFSRIACFEAAQRFGWTINSPFTYPLSSSQATWDAANVDWGAADVQVWNAAINVNLVAAQLGLPLPYSTPTDGSAGGTPPSTAALLGWIGQVSNVVYQLSPLGIGQDIFNFGKAAAAGAGALVGDIESGLQFLSRALLNLPFLMGDGVGYVVCWGINTICADLWLPLLILGAALLVIAFICLSVWPKAKVRLELRAAGAEARIFPITAQERADLIAAAREGAFEASATRAIAGQETPAVAAAPESAPSPNSAPETPEPATTPPPAAETSPETPPPGAPTSAVEEHLGELPNRAPSPEELRKIAEESERNRIETAPELAEEVPEEPEDDDDWDPDLRDPNGVSGYEESRKAAAAFAAAEAGG